MADFVGADAENMVPVKNASMGVNAVLRSLNFNKGDEIVFSDHSYLSCKNTIEFLREKRGIVAKQISIPFPCSGDDQIIDIFLRNLSSRTKLVLLDHITSPTALILPLENLLPEIKKLGILSLVDGAHGPGMLKLKLNELAADFYVGNCHKWLCSARGAAFLHINKDFSGEILPNCISNGYKLESEKSSQLFNLLFHLL